MSRAITDKENNTNNTRMTTKTTVNCWEYFKCKYGPSGKEQVCPVVEQMVGTRCWIVDKTICRDEAPKVYLDKIANCRQCEYFIKRKSGIL